MTKRALGIAVALLLVTTTFLIAVDLIPDAEGEPTRRAPSAPQDFSLESMNGRIKLTWSDPADIGDSDKIGFTVFKSRNQNDIDSPDKVIANPGPFIFSYTDSNVANGKYYF